MKQKKKETECLEALYMQYADYVKRVCFLICKDEELAESITNDVFLTLLAELEQVDFERIQKWLKVTAKNKTLNVLKKRRREVLTADFEEILDESSHDDSAEDIVLGRFIEKEGAFREERMLDALFRKNERWYYAVTMTYYLGMPQTQAAKKLGMNANSFYALLNRAKAWIKEFYEGLDEDIL